MASRQIIGSKGAVADFGATIDGTTTTLYGKFRNYQTSVFSLHIEYGSSGSDLEAAATFWVSNKEDPDETSDADWVQNTDLTFTNIAAAASAKEEHTVGNAAHKWYRIKLARTAGSGTASVWVHSSPMGG